jgi:hypothetical protein
MYAQWMYPSIQAITFSNVRNEMTNRKISTCHVTTVLLVAAVLVFGYWFAVPSTATANIDSRAIETFQSQEDVCGIAIVFRKWESAYWNGHVAYAVITSSYTLWGSVDSPDSRDIWYKVARGEQWDMVMQEMTDKGYDDAAVIYLRDGCNVRRAIAAANQTKSTRYSLIGSNCADATRFVITNFGVDVAPLLQMYPQPNDWFDNGLFGEYGMYWEYWDLGY